MLSTHGRHAGSTSAATLPAATLPVASVPAASLPLANLLAALLVAALVLLGTAWSRGTEYDENYSIFIASGVPRPAWPAGVFTAGQVRHFYRGHSTPLAIAADLRHTDVHPPLYFWSLAAWREIVGPGLFQARLLSVVFSLLALLGVAVLAAELGAPPILSLLLTLGCYGFAYTGSIARGFALAQLCAIWGTVLTARAFRLSLPRTWPIAFAAGLLLGLASFSNYLAAFAGAGCLLWLLVLQPRAWWRWGAAGLGFVLVLPADMFFFLAQRGSRVGQFPPFRLLPSLARLGKYAAANVFGGLPLYVGHIAGLILGGLLALGLAALVALIGWRWRTLARVPALRSGRWLLLFCVLATPVGLLMLGFVFNNTPIELRYIAFATPCFATLLAATFRSLRPALGIILTAALLAVQAISLLGMTTRPETMQPQAQTSRAARGLAGGQSLVLVPYGNDGVGVMAAFVNESPDDLHIERVDPGEPAATIETAALASGRSRVVLVLLGLDADSRAVLVPMRRAFTGNACWRAAGSGFDVLAFDRTAACPGPTP